MEINPFKLVSVDYNNNCTHLSYSYITINERQTQWTKRQKTLKRKKTEDDLINL